jgi:hypothetical protein
VSTTEFFNEWKLWTIQNFLSIKKMLRDFYAKQLNIFLNTTKYISACFKIFNEVDFIKKKIFFKDGMFFNWITDLSHLRSEVIFDQ